MSEECCNHEQGGENEEVNIWAGSPRILRNYEVCGEANSDKEEQIRLVPIGKTTGSKFDFVADFDPASPCDASHGDLAPSKRRWGLEEVTAALSILCIVDCVILPPALTIVGAFNFIDGSSHQRIANIAHQAIVYFVAPLGLITATSTYLKLKKVWLLLWSLTSLVILVVLHLEPVESLFVHKKLLHRLLSVLAAGSLLASNHVGRKCSCGSNCGSSHFGVI
eukprot:GHVU01031818.1.p1 GENE.GHVU01031818.1~~GHVU01031818.1.p1  ORF type:complete len:222 (+),score=27.85 GHVU01031818.1:196-861(+)